MNTPFGPDDTFDRTYELSLDQGVGFYDGGLHLLWTVDGRVFPDAPMLMVAEGDLVKMTFHNLSFDDHPMHLHLGYEGVTTPYTVGSATGNLPE